MTIIKAQSHRISQLLSSNIQSYNTILERINQSQTVILKEKYYIT